MGSILLGVLSVAFLAWLTGVGREKHIPAPEDDLTTPIDEAELEAAEQELLAAEETTTLEESEDDDWGPGTGRSALPGIM